MVMHHHEPEFPAKDCFAIVNDDQLRSAISHGEGSCIQNIIVSAISSELLILLPPNIV